MLWMILSSCHVTQGYRRNVVRNLGNWVRVCGLGHQVWLPWKSWYIRVSSVSCSSQRLSQPHHAADLPALFLTLHLPFFFATMREVANAYSVLYACSTSSHIASVKQSSLFHGIQHGKHTYLATKGGQQRGPRKIHKTYVLFQPMDKIMRNGSPKGHILFVILIRALHTFWVWRVLVWECAVVACSEFQMSRFSNS